MSLVVTIKNESHAGTYMQSGKNQINSKALLW